jgi:hypothetical protein
VALAWEKFDIDSDEERLTFKFGESFDNVVKKLKFRSYLLIKEEIKFKDL